MLSSRKLRSIERQAAKRAQTFEIIRSEYENNEHDNNRITIENQIKQMKRRVSIQQDSITRIEIKHRQAQTQCDELLKNTNNYTTKMAFITSDHDTRYLGTSGRPFQVYAEIPKMNETDKPTTRRTSLTNYTSLTNEDTPNLKGPTQKLLFKSASLRKKYSNY